MASNQSNPLDLHLLNKFDTEQKEFLHKNPESDGRGILIAILDTGVDPSLPGMQVTTDGLRKMYDVIDCSGSGDVDTSTVRTVKDGKIEGLTGRILTIPETWNCPTGKYHVGSKPIYELYTKGVEKSITSEKNKDSFHPLHNQATADALRLLTAHETEVGGSSDRVESKDKWDREDLACKVDFLKSMQNVTEAGPVADVITWHDGELWRVCLDTSFRGRLSLCKVLGGFRETGDFATLSDKDSVVYTVSVANSGNRVEIAVPTGSHGSHVAHIAAACYPDHPEQNGLAPGAQILSLNIGDNRLSAMETGQAMTRAFDLCSKLGVDIINMSFGEGSHLPDKGKVIELAQQMIQRRNVLFVCSGGNNGPALTTLGAPGGTTTGVIGIAAYLTGESADTLYGIGSDVKSNIYPWSSRGPNADGALGVSLCAPAAAYVGVPQYTRKSKQMMNGTSMSSPNAAGTIACLLSAMKKFNLPWTPFTVRLALENSALPLEGIDRLSTGQGMIKVQAAFKKLYDIESNKKFPSNLTHFDITVLDGSKRMKGIYIREPQPIQPQEFQVAVQPHYVDQRENNTEQIAFERQVILQCPEPWVSHPKTLLLLSAASGLRIFVDASKVKPGVNYTEIEGIDAADPELGPILRIPVTVIVPEKVADPAKGYSSVVSCTGGVPERRFIEVPRGTTSALITVKAPGKQSLDSFSMATVYLDDEKCYRNTERNINLGTVGNEWSRLISVPGGKTLEVTIVRPWSRGGEPANLDLHVQFNGIEKPETVFVVHGTVATVVRVQAAPFRSVSIAPSISLTSLVIPFKPQAAKIEPLGEKDVFITTGLQIHRCLLTYKVNVTKTTEVRLEFPGMTQFLYESPVDCILFQVFNSSKGFVSASGAYPDRYSHKLEKGEYTILAQIRHAEESVLDKFKDLPLHVHTKLSPITLDVHPTPEGSFTSGTASWAGKTLLPNQQKALYIGSLAEDKIPKSIAPTSGSYFVGDLTIFENSDIKKDKTKVIYSLVEFSPRPAKGLSMVTVKKNKDQKTEMEEIIRNTTIGWINKLTDDKAASELFQTCIQQYPNHLPLLTNRIKQLLARKLADQTKEGIAEAVSLSNQVLEICKPEKVLQFYGMKIDAADDLLTVEKWAPYSDTDGTIEAVKREIAEMDERRTSIIIALQALASCQLDAKLLNAKHAPPTSFASPVLTNVVFGSKTVESFTKKSLQEQKQKIDELKEGLLASFPEGTDGPKNDWYIKLLTWLPQDDSKVNLISAKHAATLGHWGRCAKFLSKASEDSQAGGVKVIDTALSEVCDELGWVHLTSHFKNLALNKSRPDYRIF